MFVKSLNLLSEENGGIVVADHFQELRNHVYVTKSIRQVTRVRCSLCEGQWRALRDACDRCCGIMEDEDDPCEKKLTLFRMLALLL